MAATRMMMVSTIRAVATSFLYKGPLIKPHTLTLCFNNNNSKKRLFSCRALYIPDVLNTVEGKPETLDYRVFFHDNSGKRFLLGMIYRCIWVMVCSTLLLKFPKNQVQRWRLLLMSNSLPSNKIQKRENLDTIRTL